jgi:hypothetical protein
MTFGIHDSATLVAGRKMRDDLHNHVHCTRHDPVVKSPDLSMWLATLNTKTDAELDLFEMFDKVFS